MLAHMTKVLRVAGPTASPVRQTTMAEQGLSEPAHLELWLLQNIDVIDPSLMVVTSQYNRWTTGAVSAAERLDILALAKSGELVVIELKRGSDKNIHLQAISYGALVSGFTIETLGEVHSEWLSRRTPESPVEVERAAQLLREHVSDEDWSDDVLQQTRLVMVAEDFPPLVLTTVEWLAKRVPELRIECHQYNVFKDDVGLMVAFDRLYPVNDLSDQLLFPTAGASSAAVRVATKQRQLKSVVRIHQAGAIPPGAPIALALAGHVRPDYVDIVNRWLDAEPVRRDVTWVDDPNKPLRWGAEPSTLSWTPSGLRNRIFEDAGLPAPTFSAADAWAYTGRSLYEVANEAASS